MQIQDETEVNAQIGVHYSQLYQFFVTRLAQSVLTIFDTGHGSGQCPAPVRAMANAVA